MENKTHYDSKKYELIFEGSNVGVWEWPDISQQDISWSPRMSEILGLDHATYKPSLEGYFDLVFEDDRSTLQEKLELHLEENVTFEVEYRIVLPSGEIKWVQGSGQAYRDENGSATGMSGIITDIHARKVAEKKMQETLAFLSEVEEKSEIGSFRWFPKSLHFRLSSGAKGLLGIQEENEVTLGEFLNVVIPENQEKIQSIFTNEVSPNTKFDVSFQIMRKGLRYMSISGTTQLDSLTGEAYSLGIIRDRTNQKEKEEQVQELISNLQRSNEDLEQFAYVASHDLQEPLRKIQIFAERLATKSEHLPEKERMYVDRMNNAAGRMQTLIRDLLDFSRASRKKTTAEEIDLNHLFETILSDLENKIQSSSAEVDIDDLPTIYGNNGQLYRLFLNLLSNSIKFSKPDVAPHIRVTYSIVRRKELEQVVSSEVIYARYHCISVIDNGIGFESEFREKIFTIFQRLHGRNDYQGTGIGLAIARKIITNHGGFIVASSEPNKGSSFHVYFPKHTN